MYVLNVPYTNKTVTKINVVNLLSLKMSVLVTKNRYTNPMQLPIENLILVSYIAIYIDSKNSYKGIYRDLITDYSVMNWSALRTRWSSKEIIEYYSNRKFKEKKITEEEKENYIKEVDKDINYLIIEDTLYITCYIN